MLRIYFLKHRKEAIMIKLVTMYSVVCDRCGKTYNENDGVIAWLDEGTASTIREHLINGYWRGDLSDYFKDGSFDVSLKSYKVSSYDNVMDWLDRYK